jgi:hypothetical protein
MTPFEKWFHAGGVFLFLLLLADMVGLRWAVVVIMAVAALTALVDLVVDPLFDLLVRAVNILLE